MQTTCTSVGNKDSSKSLQGRDKLAESLLATLATRTLSDSNSSPLRVSNHGSLLDNSTECGTHNTINASNNDTAFPFSRDH